MTRERRLGRGLEALLGRVPGPAETPARAPAAAPEQGHPTIETTNDDAQQPDTLPMRSAEPPRPESFELPPAEPAAEPAPEPVVETPEPVAETSEPTPEGTFGPLRLDVGQIDSNPSQPRLEFDQSEIQALADSLNVHGLLQPIVVRKIDDRFQLVAGERRLRAAKLAGWADVPANIIDADDRDMAELAIIENLQRKDLNAIEKAASFQRYIQQYNCTQEELAARLKLDRSTIANLIRLLELPEEVCEAVRQGKITQGHARALLPLGDEPDQIQFCQRIQEEGLNVRQTEALVQETIAAADAEPLGLVGKDGRPGRARRPQSEHLTALEQELKAALGTKVKIKHNARGRGKLTIHFRSHEEFERLRVYLTDSRRPEGQAHAG